MFDLSLLYALRCGAFSILTEYVCYWSFKPYLGWMFLRNSSRFLGIPNVPTKNVGTVPRNGRNLFLSKNKLNLKLQKSS